MAGNIKGITIEFNGDTTKLGKALTEVNKEIRQTDSALREVDKALKLDPTNVELLTQKEALLAKQVEQVSDKLELQKIAADEAAEALAEGTISQEEYAKLSAEVATTTNKLNDLQSQASGTSGELEATGDAASEAGEKAEESASSWVNWGEILASAGQMALEAVRAVADGIAEVASALTDMTLETASYADDILTLSSTSGVAADTLQALAYGEEILDVSSSSVAGAMTKLVRAMGNAQGSASEYAELVDELNLQLQNGEITADEYAEALEANGNAFSNLGIDILDSNGELRDSEEVFWEVIDALGQISNETERDAAAMSLLGRSARELNPLIEAGSEGFREIYDEAEQAGAIMGDELLEEFDGLNDTMSRLDQGAQAAKRAMGMVLLPVLQSMGTQGVDLINEFTNAILETDGDVEAFGSVIDEMVPKVMEFLNEWLPTLIDFGGTIIQTLAEALLSNLDVIIQSGFDLLMAVGQGIVDNLASLAPVVANMIVQLANFIITNLPTVLTSAIQIVVAVVDGISQALPELIPAAVDCVTQVATALIDNVDLLLPAALELILAIALGLVAAIPDLIAVVPQLIDAIQNEMVDLSSSLADAALTWGADLIDGFVDGFFSGFGRLEDACSQLGNMVYDYLHHSTPEKGPLANDDEWGSDFVENFIDGMDSEQAALERSVYQTANVIYDGMTNDYSGQLAGISSQLGAIGAGGSVPQVINVYVGSQRFATAVVNANASENYRTGGV